jgi:predicted nucleotidyltransferase
MNEPENLILKCVAGSHLYGFDTGSDYGLEAGCGGVQVDAHR